jgi:hypothetical protein
LVGCQARSLEYHFEESFRGRGAEGGELGVDFRVGAFEQVGGVEDCVELGGAGVEGEGGVSGVVVSEVRVLCCEEAFMIFLLCFALA